MREINYIAELDDETLKELEKTILIAEKAFCISNLNDGETIAREVNYFIEKILKTGDFPKEYTNLDEVCIALGALYGHSLCISYGWSWEEFGPTQENAVYGVFSPEKNFCKAPFSHVYSILIGLDYGKMEKTENTILLSYNMIKDIDKNPMFGRKYVSLM